jgi:hypothetical protein
MASNDHIDPHEHAAGRLPIRIRLIIAAMLLFFAAMGSVPVIAALMLM